MAVTRDPEFCHPVGGFTGNVEQQGPGVHRRTGISNVSTPTGCFWHIIGHDGSEAALYGSYEEALFAFNETRTEPPPPIHVPLQVTPPIFVPKVDPPVDLSDVPVSEGGLTVVSEKDQVALAKLRDDQFAELVDPVAEDPWLDHIVEPVGPKMGLTMHEAPDREVLIEYDADGNFERESEVVDAIFEED